MMVRVSEQQVVLARSRKPVQKDSLKDFKILKASLKIYFRVKRSLFIKRDKSDHDRNQFSQDQFSQERLLI